MSDKKNDDYGVQLRDLGRDPESGDGKMQTAYSRSPSPRGHSGGFDWSKIDNSPGASVLGYCLSSISMTVVNKYVVSGSSWNMNFLYLAIQVRSRLVVFLIHPPPPSP
jgi:GDP-mannose transporter